MSNRPTRRSNDHKLPAAEKTPSRPEPTPVATSSRRETAGTPPSATSTRDERKRQILLALAVVVLVVLSFLAGRL